ncbi:helix-turn-helix transcriptional regulator [Streptomyces reticuliscabiei]|uniref:helix-turn-helix transcriptional regulator n=1 Tax=Streptomyces reticuliscabiei TaxID=146821 RepID=UPI001FEC94F0|nr:helix-turn-helix domain-containing protein [Streptomyces reticuliscabiei]
MSELLKNEAPTYLTTKDVAARYRTAPSTVRYWRHIGYGPKGIKVGRQILYSLTEIGRFEKALTDQSVRESA